MEGAHLRPVPRRPEGPVDLERAAAYVSSELPGLAEANARVLALVEIAGLGRDQVAADQSISHEQVAELLARSRKALRRALFPLPGSGWCERAERLISDRLDGELQPTGPRLLDAHLRNCARCVEHELRLAQATEGLLARFLEHDRASRPEPPPAPERPAEPEPAPNPPVLRIVQPQAKAPPPPRPAELPRPARPAPEPKPVAPERHTGTESVSGAVWMVLLVLAVVLALATVGFTLVGVLGGSV
jgi:putative zinc finger protein